MQQVNKSAVALEEHCMQSACCHVRGTSCDVCLYCYCQRCCYCYSSAELSYMLLRNLLIVDSSPTHSQTSIAVVCTVHSIYCRLQRGLDIPGWSAKQDDHGVTSPATVRPALQSPQEAPTVLVTALRFAVSISCNGKPPVGQEVPQWCTS
jgi:hypothetical protein